MDDIKILNFLLLNKFSIEKCKNKIDMYYTMRNILPDMFINPKRQELQDYMKKVNCAPHPKFYKGMYRVYLANLKVPNGFSMHLSGVHVTNMLEIMLYKDCVFGDIIIVDLKNCSLSDLLTCTPIGITKMYQIYKQIYSIRLQRYCLVNCPTFIATLLGVLKATLPEKIFSRFEFHKDHAVLKELFSQDDLPEDYGGKGPSLQALNDLLKDDFVKYAKRFDELDSMKTDESLRPEELRNDDILGFYGSFKKLNVD